MTQDQLRTALRELNGQRDLALVFAGVHAGATGFPSLTVKRAMLIPDESDHLVKVSDGAAVYILDAERIAWIKIG